MDLIKTISQGSSSPEDMKAFWDSVQNDPALLELFNLAKGISGNLQSSLMSDFILRAVQFLSTQNLEKGVTAGSINRLLSVFTNENFSGQYFKIQLMQLISSGKLILNTDMSLSIADQPVSLDL